jgi:hypothetical protein
MEQTARTVASQKEQKRSVLAFLKKPFADLATTVYNGPAFPTRTVAGPGSLASAQMFWGGQIAPRVCSGGDVLGGK